MASAHECLISSTTENEPESGVAGNGRGVAESNPVKATMAAETDERETKHVGSLERALPVEPHPAHSHSRYPLNSRRLTTWYLCALAGALGLPTAGSQDQLRQWVEGIVQRDHDYQSVMVVVRESLKTEHVVVLEDSEGEFLQSEPVYRDAPSRHVRAAEDVHLIEELRRQLEEARGRVASTANENEEQTQLILELREAL